MSLCLILPVNPLAFLILGIILQSFYVFLLLLNIGKNFKNNCQCFSLNALWNGYNKEHKYKYCSFNIHNTYIWMVT
ncbi:hypothetical protein ACT7DQ_22315 [Bacillus cereus]